MVIYEVNLAVAPEAAEAFTVWLRHHIGELLELDGFEHATWLRREPEGEEAATDRVLITVHYAVRDHATLRHYFEHYAAAFRDDGLARFPNQFTATRRVLLEEETFGRA